jgi:predicted MPP superfamily phosphohydrolase
MKSTVFKFLLIILVFLTVTDLYVCWSIYRNFKSFWTETAVYLYFALSILIWLFIAASLFRFILSFNKNAGPALFNRFNTYTGLILFFYCPKIFFIPFSLLADLLLIIAALFGKDTGMLISSARILTDAGLAVAVLSAILVLYGIFYGRFNFVLRESRCACKGLPDQFEGLKVIHFSDLHTGSLRGHQKRFTSLVRLVNDHHPDLILFTGDMVNTFAEELDGWLDIWGGLTARLGKFAVLGNHDYGEYFSWQDRQQWLANLERLKKYIEQMGFRLLMNESVRISLNGQHITLAGVENWGLPPFRQYGDLQKALETAAGEDFKVLLSHDPSHWAEEVLDKTDIRLTLSGHTHGMQFGFRIGKARWSPIRIKYPRWGGWYQEGEQYLHVSTGLGYIAFPFRLGIPPEVVLIELCQG